MPAFHTIAVPHRDILEGKYDMDVYAADLAKVVKGEGSEEYRDRNTFFERTYETKGLRNIMDVVQQRLEGKGGDAVIQITTPFGGGKTHTLIALYHRAKEMKINTVVIAGTSLGGDPLWELIEKQLTGKVDKLKGMTSPGRERLAEVLKDHTPLLILMDEVAQYTEKAASKIVGESTLAAQTLTFMQDLSELMGIMDRACLVFTLPSSSLETAGEKAEEMRQKLQHLVGRVERVYRPVNEDEISRVIRRRLFSSVDMEAAGKVVNRFVKYADKENILPEGVEPTEYRDRFLESYPFMPEVIDVFYKRWGSFTTFQRTRGVLRLLSLVIGSLKESDKSYISLSDIDLSDSGIRGELLKHIDQTFESVISSDITDMNSGSKLVDDEIGSSYRGLRIGTRTSAAIFMYSFSAGPEKGGTSREIKRSASVIGNPASIIMDVLDKLDKKLFFLQKSDDRYYFDNLPNLNRLFLTKKENVRQDQVIEEEKALLKKNIGGRSLKVSLWPQKNEDVPDAEALSLVILQSADMDLMLNILENKGNGPRVNKNMLVFLCPSDSQRIQLESAIKDKLAWEAIKKEMPTLNLSDAQSKDVNQRFKHAASNCGDAFFKAYLKIYLPDRDGTGNRLSKKSMGEPTYGDTTPLDERVLEYLISQGYAVKKLAPKVLRDKYLKEKHSVGILQIYKSWLTTPGEMRPVSKAVIEESVREGVKNKIFGFGYLVNGNPDCKYFGDEPTLSFSEDEVIIDEEFCEQKPSHVSSQPSTVPAPSVSQPSAFPTQKPDIASLPESHLPPQKLRKHVKLSLTLPKNKGVEFVRGVLNPLGKKFERVKISIEADGGEIPETEWSSTVIETLQQIQAEYKDECEEEKE